MDQKTPESDADDGSYSDVPLIPSTGNKRYDELPEAIKGMYSLKEYMWLSDRDKNNLVQSETEPDWEE